MKYTPYDEENGQFSDRCHWLAREVFYPHLFNVPACEITWADTQLGNGAAETALDGMLGIDRVAYIARDGLRGPIPNTIQERFRRPQYAHHRDLTITEWNHNTNLQSELHKLSSNLFVYGYANHESAPTDFIEVVVCSTEAILRGIQTDRIAYERKPNYRSNQTFLCITFDNLRKANCISFRYPMQQARLFL